MTLTDSDWQEFHDSNLVLRAPGYLRKHRSMMFFQAPKKRKAGQNITMFAVSVLTHPDSVEGSRDAIEGSKPRVDPQMGVEFLLLRRGKPEWLDNGLELVAETRNLSTGQLIAYDLRVVFMCSNIHLCAEIDGDGDLDQFEQVARSIIESIRPFKEGEMVPPVKRTRSVAGGLGRADKARLSAALEGLPPELAYLHKPILAIARQDQDLLGSGEADIGPIERSLRKVAKAGAIARTATAHADALHRWLTALPDCDGPWAGPIGFVEGVLRGYAQFGPGAV
jgi:hypothetical protein